MKQKSLFLGLFILALSAFAVNITALEDTIKQNFNNIGTKFELDEVIPKFEMEVRADSNGEIIKNRDGSERRFNTDKIIGWKYNVTIKDGQFKKKSTQVSVDNPEALVDNDYIQAMDQVPVTFDNLQATMISSTMYYKANAIHLVDVKQK